MNRTISLDSTQVRFSMEDDVSRRWFARYAEGELHEPRLTRLLWGSLQRSSVFVDVGAFLGYYTCIACRVDGLKHIYAFEIDPDNFKLLSTNVELNGCNRAEIHNTAVGAQPGLTRYMVGTDPFGAAHRIIGSDRRSSTRIGAALKRWSGRGPRDANQVSLDSFFQDKTELPDVVKIDAEGAEGEILSGMEHIIRKAGELEIYVEVHPGAMSAFFSTNPDEILEFLLTRGFECHEVPEFRSGQGGEEFPLREIALPSGIQENTVVRARRRRERSVS